jgi:hypothetical protein
MGSRGLEPVRRLLIGSVSEDVIHHARCPVLVVRSSEEARPPERVIVGDDGSNDASRAGESAAGISKLFGADSVPVRGYQDPPEPVGGWSVEDRRKLDEAVFQQVEVVNERAKEFEEVLGSHPEVTVVGGTLPPSYSGSLRMIKGFS